MSSDYDAVIIGAGHNGLSCGALLARRGWDVLVLEQAQEPGGACKTGEITRPGFKHDLYSTNISLFLASPTYEEIGDDMHRHGFDVESSGNAYASLFPEGEGLAVYTDRDRTRGQIESVSAADWESWQEMAGYFGRMAPYLFPLLQTPLPSRRAFQHILRLYWKEGFDEMMNLFSMLLKTPREFGQYWFETEEMRSLVAPWGLHLDYGPDVSGGAMFPFIETMNYYQNGFPFARGGSANLIGGIVDVLEENGGELRCDTPVSDVIVSDGAATGVRTAGGEEITAGTVVANTTPTVVYTHLVDEDDVPAGFLRKVDNYRYGPCTMQIHFALDDPVPWEAGEEFGEICYQHVGPYVDDMAKTYQQAQAGTLPSNPMLLIAQPTAADPSRAPDGKHILWLHVRPLPRRIEGDEHGEIDATTWPEAKGPMAERVIEKIESYAPGFEETILDYTVLGPDDLEEDNPSLKGGDSLAGSHHLDQHFAFRPFPGWSGHDSPIEDLYHCGASTWPGAGLNGTSGYLVAEKLSGSTLKKLTDWIPV